MSDDPIGAAEHVVAQALATDHADCEPGECEFVGHSTWGVSEFDITAEKIVWALNRAGLLAQAPVEERRP